MSLFTRHVHYYKKNFTFVSHSKRMTGKTIIFNDKKINKSSFYRNKKLYNIDKIDVNKILVSKRESYGTKKSFKDFIGYDDNDVIRPLSIKSHQMIGYAECFHSNKTMSFEVIDKKLSKRYTKIQEKISSLMNKEFDSEPVYGDRDKYVKTKINSYGDEINTNFQGRKLTKKATKKNTSYKCLSLIMLGSVIRVI